MCMNVGNYHSSVLFEDCYAKTNKVIQAEIEMTNFVGHSVRYLFCINENAVLCKAQTLLHRALFLSRTENAF